MSLDLCGFKPGPRLFADRLRALTEVTPVQYSMVLAIIVLVLGLNLMGLLSPSRLGRKR